MEVRFGGRWHQYLGESRFCLCPWKIDIPKSTSRIIDSKRSCWTRPLTISLHHEVQCNLLIHQREIIKWISPSKVPWKCKLMIPFFFWIEFPLSFAKSSFPDHKAKFAPQGWVPHKRRKNTKENETSINKLCCFQNTLVLQKQCEAVSSATPQKNRWES